jgi:hypothetical protein
MKERIVLMGNGLSSVLAEGGQNMRYNIKIFEPLALSSLF